MFYARKRVVELMAARRRRASRRDRLGGASQNLSPNSRAILK